MSLRKTVVAIFAVAVVGIFVGMGIAHAQGGVPSGTVRWEHHFVRTDVVINNIFEFNRLGAEGWEYVGTNWGRSVFRRRLP